MFEELSRIAAAERESQAQYETTVNVCVAAGCLSSGSDKVKAALEAEVKQRGQDKCCKVKGVGCMGLCSRGPLVSVEKKDSEAAPVLYQDVKPEDAPALADSLTTG